MDIINIISNFLIILLSILWQIDLIMAQIGFSSVPCSQRQPKIVGGLEADRNEMPYIVSLMRRGGHFCGATIIHERWILTAGHCICNGLNNFIKPTQIQGVMGLHSITDYLNGVAASKSNEPQQVHFRTIVPHPNYECTNVKNDIALIELMHPVQFNEHIRPSCLTLDKSSKSYENEIAIVSGWGWTKENQDDGQRADKLRKASVRVWNNKVCEKSYQSFGQPKSSITDTQLCAGFENGGIDSCWADSGGPLMAKDNTLLGVVSTGIGCARPGLPGIYTRVSKYIPWMESVIFSRN